MADVLLVGNGLNRISEDGYSWRKVMKDLASYVGKAELITHRLKEKPFTLVFEEIFFRAARARRMTEIDLKEKAADLINSVPPNNLHRRILHLGFDTILTTNYDYNIEISSKIAFGKSLTRETRYSLHRRRCSSGTCVWHIHGEAEYPNTLVLSHEHYSDYIDQMQDIVRGFMKEHEKGTPDLQDTRPGKDQDWVRIFLNSDIHIIGMGLDFTEIELWWLLSVKERCRIRGFPVGKTKLYRVNPNLSNREKAKEEILTSFGVEIDTQYQLSSFKDSYDAFFSSFEVMNR